MDAGSFMLSMKEGKQYTEKNITVLPFSKALDDYVGQRLVYYMAIDIEGFEYSILSQILPGKRLAVQGITFCQISAEFHTTRLNNDKQIKEFLQQFIVSDSNYLPIYHASFLPGHHKISFINIDRIECQQAFNIAGYLK